MKNQVTNIVNTIYFHGGNKFAAVIKESERVQLLKRMENEMNQAEEKFEIEEEIKLQVLVREKPKGIVEIQNKFNMERQGHFDESGTYHA